jgi:protein TonB
MKLLISCFLLLSVACFSQENGGRGTIRVEKSSCTLVKGSDSIYSMVDRMPQFQGGQDEMLKWLAKNMKYPEVAIEESSTATVFVSFIVEASGEIGEITVFKSNNTPFETEALRLIRSMPKWEPGVCNKKKVPVKMNYPLKFGLQ